MTKPERPSLATLPKKPETPAKAAEAFLADTPAPQVPQARTIVPPSLQAAPIEAEEPLQRLAIEIPLSLHIAIKMGCAARRTKMRDEILALLEAHYRPTGDA